MLGFEQGIPVTLDGKPLPLDALIDEVSFRSLAPTGWGRLDMVENRRVGMKSRETYECPAALALLLADRDLEDLTLYRGLADEKLRLEPGGRSSSTTDSGSRRSKMRSTRSSFPASNTSQARSGCRSRRGNRGGSRRTQSARGESWGTPEGTNLSGAAS